MFSLIYIFENENEPLVRHIREDPHRERVMGVVLEQSGHCTPQIGKFQSFDIPPINEDRTLSRVMQPRD